MMLLEYNPKLLTVSQHSAILVSSLTNGFLKFLTRFSGENELKTQIIIIYDLRLPSAQ